MKTFMLIVSMTAFIFAGCHQQKKSESLVIEMTNPTDRYRNNAGIVIERSQLNNQDSTLLPVLYDNNGKLIVSQLDGNGTNSHLSAIFLRMKTVLQHLHG